MKRLILVVVVAGVLAPALPAHASSTWYLSTTGNGTTGTSWANAWKQPDQVNWAGMTAGDTLMVDGGANACISPATGPIQPTACGMLYSKTMAPTVSGITIKLATEAGRNGTARFWGGRSVLLPYCHQMGYTATAVRQNGILIGNYSGITIDGSHRGGIMVYGAVSGVRVSSETANNLTFKRMEVFDNGSIGTSSGGGANTDAEGFSLKGGTGITFIGDIIHDNGQDGVQDETRSDNTLNGLTFDTDFIYNRREHPSHPGEPFNDLQVIGDNTCTHADSIQLFDGGTSQSGLTVENSVIGPLVNQGVYPSDGGQHSYWNNVTIQNDLMLAVGHNIQSDPNGAVSGWAVTNDTLIAPTGGSEAETSGSSGAFTNDIKYGGFWFFPGSWTYSGNVWNGGDSIPGTHQDPGFTNPPAMGSLGTYATYAGADFTPSGCPACVGSSIHSIAAILAAIDALP